MIFIEWSGWYRKGVFGFELKKWWLSGRVRAGRDDVKDILLITLKRYSRDKATYFIKLH